ncbi:MAG: choice-of-anchor E domain-containing protein [Planctomycetota bacterium]
MHTRMRWLVCLAGVLSLTGSVSAGTISYNGSFGPRSFGFGPQALITLPLFDPSLGVLTEVAIKFVTSTSGGTIRWDNESELPTSVTLGIGSRTRAQLPGGGNVTAQAAPSSGVFPLVSADSDGAPDFSGSDAVKLIGGSASAEGQTVVTGSDTSPYVGPGNFDVLIDSEVDTTIITNGGSGASDLGDENDPDGTVEGEVEITYTYEDPTENNGPEVAHTPEPASLAIWGLGGLGMFLLMRRRNRVA